MDRLSRGMRHLSGSLDAVTSLVDFYGFRDKAVAVRAIRDRCQWGQPVSIACQSAEVLDEADAVGTATDSLGRPAHSVLPCLRRLTCHRWAHPRTRTMPRARRTPAWSHPAWSCERALRGGRLARGVPRVGPDMGLFAVGNPDGTAPGVHEDDPGADGIRLQWRGSHRVLERLRKAGKLPNGLVRAIRNRFGQFDEGSVLPCVQLHEFEGLLLSDLEAYGRTLADAPVAELRPIRSELGTPEDITGHPDTAPSKRIETPVPRCRMTLDGPLPALGFGLDTIRSECPRFDVRLGRPASP